MSIQDISHYAQIAPAYHLGWGCGSHQDFESWQFEKICDALQLDASDNKVMNLLDLGAGTGRFSGLLKNAIGNNIDITCVDNCEQMVAIASKNPNLHAVCSDVVDYLEQSTAVDRILLKESVHHIQDAYQLEKLYRGIKNNLKPDGKCLICTRLHDNFDYPLFTAAKEQWKISQPEFSIYVDAMREVGLRNITVRIIQYPVQLSLEQWLDFIRMRIWSIFSYENFSDDQLAAGLNELSKKYANQESLSFNERMILIRADS